MTLRNFSSRIGLVAVLAATLSACETTPKAPPQAPKLADFLSKADQASVAGNKEQAVTLWKQGAQAFPTEKQPWVNIAQTRYDAGQYGDAIQAALEVLVRDPNDTLANSIIAVSGLRLSTRALSDLSRQNNLNGSTKSEAQELAKLLRESLGESTILANGGVRTAQQPNQPAQPPRTTNRRQPPKPGAGAGSAPATAAPAATSGDPFQALK